MKDIIGTSNKYLDINLTDRTWSIYQPEARDLQEYIGGKGLGLKVYYDRLGDRLDSIDPLSPENMLCFMMGIFVGTGAVCSARFEGITKSPLTGLMVTSSCGGEFGLACKTAGYDGVIVTGKSETPVVMRIDEDGVTFEDAGETWGMDTHEVQHHLCKSAKDKAIVIGPAGENQVLYANIASGHRFLGRGGMGAVMGSKNLKAIVARGRAYKIVPADQKLFEKTKKKSNKFIKNNKFSKNYKNFGTNAGVNPGVDKGYAPINNFQQRTDERFRNLSGENMAEKYKTTHSVCMPCSILCGHKGTYPDGKVRQIPEYETIGLFGGNIGNFDPDPIGAWNEEMNNLGMDTISAGSTIGWAMEAGEKGLRSTELKFGKIDNISKILEDIAYKRGEGADLALGTKRLSDKYGGKDFAIQVKGLEMAAYDPRGGWGQGLNYAVNNRGGCHLGSYPIAFEVLLGFLPQYTTLSKAKWVNFLENLYSGINSCHTCLFTGFGYLLEPPIAKFTPKPILKVAMTLLPDVAMKLLDWSLFSEYITAISGNKMGMYEFYRCGNRIHVLERYMNTKMGISAKDDTLPLRFLTEADAGHKVKKVVKLEPMVKNYYKAKGYDKNGLPTPKLMKKLKIEMK
ncbi:MAG: aldehyde ferredoxin oxidoreductase family protein [Spirochaetales bacterium]|nr:aldehyde ferredoxin oxidoreductase family protein [Spirochaetales bacterium]